MAENTNTHLATFKCMILDSSCRETRRSKFCSKELTFLAGSQANISTAERSRGDWRWRESHGEPGPRRESLDCWTGSQHQSQDSSSAPRPSFISDPSPQRSQTPEASFCLRDNAGRVWEPAPEFYSLEFHGVWVESERKRKCLFSLMGNKRLEKVSCHLRGCWLETPYDRLSCHRHFLVFIDLTGSWIVERFSNA